MSSSSAAALRLRLRLPSQSLTVPQIGLHVAVAAGDAAAPLTTVCVFGEIMIRSSINYGKIKI